MKIPQRILLALATAFGIHCTAWAQNAPVVVEAETGTSVAPTVTGATVSDWASRTVTAAGTTPAITYVTSLTDVAAYTANGGVGSGAPATDARVLTYSVTFPGAGSYDLYARIRVGRSGGRQRRQLLLRQDVWHEKRDHRGGLSNGQRAV